MRSRGYSDRTISAYLAGVKAFAAWCEGTYGTPFDPASVTSLDVADYRRHLLNKNRKPATVNHHLDALSVFFAWAAGEGIVQSNPTTDVRRVKEQNRAPRWLDRREVGAFVRAVQQYGTPRDAALVALAIHAGLRVSEIVAVRVGDVVIRERSGLVRVRQGKGDKYREVPLNITARRVLGAYMAAVKSEWLFPAPRDNRRHITSRAAEKIVARYARLSGVAVTPHILRHTFSKRLVDSGVPLDRVAVLLGHSNLNTTARYSRPSQDDLQDAVDLLAWE